MSDLLREARNTSAFLKMGIYGCAGTGKTYSASKVAIGLSNFIKSDKPIAWADTETGSDYVKPTLFDPAGKKILVSKTKAFADLLKIVDEAQAECDIFIIDSISHFHDELMSAYLLKNDLKRLRLKDWQPIKATWRDFTDKFVNSKLHIILCGRSSDIWEEVEDPTDGSKELKKTGTRMRAEREISFEPSLLVEMEAVQLSSRVGGQVVRRAFIKKDRFSIIDGKFFDNPSFEDFLPHIQLLNLNGEHLGFETGHDSTAMFDDPNVGERRALNKEILTEEISNEIKKLFPGQSEADKLARIKLLEEVFGTNSWTKISTLTKNDVLADGLNVIRAKVYDASKPTPQAVPVIPLDESGNGKKAAKKGARA
jgi:hypothetical protein